MHAMSRMADALGDLIEEIQEASKAPAKRRGTSLKPTVERLTASLYENGALPDDLVRLIGLATQPRHLDQASLAAIIRNLYPATRVPGDAVLEVVGCLGHGQLKPSLTVQSHLLRWLVMVYHVLDEPDALSRAYAVLFNLLDTAAIRPQLCHVLALITRRKHVRPYRIQAVLELSRQTGSDPALTGLLRVFKNYYPEIIVGTAIRGRAAAFKHPDTSWRERLDEIQEDHRSRTRADDTAVRNGFRINHLLGRQMKGLRSSVPAVHTLHAQENSVTLEEIDSADSFVRNLEKIELPSQLVAVLADPLLQKLMVLRPDGEASARVSNWIKACITDVRTGDAEAGVLLDVVEVLQDYIAVTKTLPPILLRIFQELFQVWNGRDGRDAVLDVLAHMPVAEFQPLYGSVLQPLEHAILGSDEDTAGAQLVLLTFYNALLQNWTTALVSSPDPAAALPLPALSALIAHTHTLALTLSQTCGAKATTTTHLHILDLHETAATILAHPAMLRHAPLTLPSPTLIYTLHFSHSAAVLARLCDTISTHKRALEAIMSPPLHRALAPDESAAVKTFNGFLMDICNCVWRVRAFAVSDTNAQGCHLGPDVAASLAAYCGDDDDEAPLAAAFGLSHSPVLGRWALETVRELEEAEMAERGEDDLRPRHAGPVTQRSLVALRGRGGLAIGWQEYRLAVLGHLDERGFGGVGRLMYNTMKTLMGGKKGGSRGKRRRSQSQSQSLGSQGGSSQV